VAAILSSGMVYPQSMVVNSIDDEQVTLRTSTGHIYVMEGREDYEVGDVVAVIMYTSGTQTVEDDAIIMARYSGFVAS
jgi:hypothetical protein